MSEKWTQEGARPCDICGKPSICVWREVEKYTTVPCDGIQHYRPFDPDRIHAACEEHAPEAEKAEAEARQRNDIPVVM